MDTDVRGAFITKMNDGLKARGEALLTPRQEHLVREFVNDEGRVSPKDIDLFNALLASNSS